MLEKLAQFQRRAAGQERAAFARSASGSTRARAPEAAARGRGGGPARAAGGARRAQIKSPRTAHADGEVRAIMREAQRRAERVERKMERHNQLVELERIDQPVGRFSQTALVGQHVTIDREPRRRRGAAPGLRLRGRLARAGSRRKARLGWWA